MALIRKQCHSGAGGDGGVGCWLWGLGEREIVVVALLFYVHGKHLRSCRDGQLT